MKDVIFSQRDIHDGIPLVLFRHIGDDNMAIGNITVPNWLILFIITIALRLIL